MAAEPMSIDEARAFIDRVPWRWVRRRPSADRDGKPADDPSRNPPDPHQYVILEWREVPGEDFERFRVMIRRDGYSATYRAPYRPDHEMRNRYIEIDGWCYWWIYPNMLNRERAEDRKHVPVPG